MLFGEAEGPNIDKSANEFAGALIASASHASGDR